MGIEIFAAFLGLLGTLIGLGVSASNQSADRELSDKLNQENIDMTREENAINREREDNYFQRSKADAISAGYSPLVVSGSHSPATVSVPQNTFMPNLSGYSQQIGNLVSSGFDSASNKLFQSSQNEKNRNAQSENLAKTLLNSESITEKQEATKRYVAELGADTDTANTIAKIVSTEKLNGYDNATRVAGGLPWLLTEQGQSVVTSDSKSGKRSISYDTVNRYKRDYDGLLARGLRNKGYTMGYFIQARAYFDDPTVSLSNRVSSYVEFMKGNHPNIPYQYTFKD